MSKAEAAREALYAEAARAGFTVTRSSSGTVDVFKTRKMPNGGIVVTRGIRVYPNGTAFSLTVDLSSARALRGIAALRRAWASTSVPEARARALGTRDRREEKFL